MFSCEFCEISKNAFFTEHLWTTASEFVTEMLIFQSSRSQMFSKIGALKNFTILESIFHPPFTEHPRWLLLNFLRQQVLFCS